MLCLAGRIRPIGHRGMPGAASQGIARDLRRPQAIYDLKYTLNQ